MVVNWIPLSVGLLFGLIPPLKLLSSECRFLSFEVLWQKIFRPDDGGTRKRRRWWKLPLVWVDPIRGYVVAEMLSKSFRAGPGAGYVGAQMVMGVFFTTLFIVLAVQTKGRPYERESLSPAGFMAGMMVGLFPPVVWIGALVVGAATAVALQGYVAGYLAAAVMVGGLGLVFIGRNPALIGGYVVLMAAPVWMSWLRRSVMVTPVRC